MVRGTTVFARNGMLAYYSMKFALSGLFVCAIAVVLLVLVYSMDDETHELTSAYAIRPKALRLTGWVLLAVGCCQMTVSTTILGVIHNRNQRNLVHVQLSDTVIVEDPSPRVHTPNYNTFNSNTPPFTAQTGHSSDRPPHQGSQLDSSSVATPLLHGRRTQYGGTQTGVRLQSSIVEQSQQNHTSPVQVHSNPRMDEYRTQVSL